MSLDTFKLFQQGAEAKIYKGIYLGKPALAKERFIKRYRHPDLDALITKERMKAESRAIVKCKSAGIRTPMLFMVDYKRRTIFLEYFEGHITAKDYIESNCDGESLKILSNDIGKVIGKMHRSNVIHGDLTSSNILLVKRDPLEGFIISNLDIIIIDFGLAHIESSAEDKGVDLYVLERALMSTHGTANIMFPNILKGYEDENKKDYVEVLHKYEEVRARGRKRTMVG